MSEKKMTKKKVSEKRIKDLAGKLQDKKDAELKLEEEKAWCGNEPHELPRPKDPENPDDPCGNTPHVLPRPKDPETPEDPCGNGGKPKLPRTRPDTPLDPRVVGRTRKGRG